MFCLLGNGLNPDLAEEKVLDVYGPQGLRKFINTNLSLARSPLPYKFNVHELIPEEDQYPPEWNDWPVDHVDHSEKPLEQTFQQTKKSKCENGHRWVL